MTSLFSVNFTIPHENSTATLCKVHHVHPMTPQHQTQLQNQTIDEAPWISRRTFRYRSEYNHRAKSYLWCNPAAMKILAPLLDDQANGVLVIHNDVGEVLGYHFKPATVHYSTEYPNYAQIAAERPEHIHYFFKFPQQNYQKDHFFLVTESFVQAVHEHHIEGAVFCPKWNGKLVGIQCQD